MGRLHRLVLLVLRVEAEFLLFAVHGGRSVLAALFLGNAHPPLSVPGLGEPLALVLAGFGGEHLRITDSFIFKLL